MLVLELLDPKLRLVVPIRELSGILKLELKLWLLLPIRS